MRVSIFMILVLFLAGCSTEPPTKPEPVAQWVLGGEEYVNWAWGYVDMATYIDSLGQIDTVRYALADSIWTLGTNNVYTRAQIARLLRDALPLSRRVPNDTLQRISGLIRPASAGPYSDTISRGADQGEWISFEFLYDSTSDTYRKIELKVWGDWAYTNLAPQAGKLDSIIARVTQRQW